MKQVRSTAFLLAMVLSPAAQAAEEICQAVQAVNHHLTQSGVVLDDYKLIGAQNFVIPGRYLGPERWLMTYKPRRLIPASDDDLAGTGGELMVMYDSQEQTFEITYGE